MKLGNIFITCVVLLIGISRVNAGNIDKAFKALEVFNYFEAKSFFEKGMKKSPSAANYGLAQIYFRTDNPFHNLDSAFVCIQRSEKSYSTIKEKEKVRLKKYNFDYLHIAELRTSISTTFFNLALQKPSEELFDSYQNTHPWAQEKFRAIELRDSIAYSKAEKQNNSKGFAEFLKKYPDSELKITAQSEFNRLEYLEETKAGTLVSYINFTKEHATNPYYADAEDQIYRISTQNNKVKDYAAFVETFPKNKNTEQAWRKLYQLYMVDYSSERVSAFEKEYPNYPYKDELERDKSLANSIIIPFKKEGQFGWMDLNGKIVIEAMYGSVGFFKEGLAWAEKSGKYGFVNKANEIIVPFKFESATDFDKGRAIVELNEKFGSIDRSGTFIIPAQFKDIGQYTEGLIYAQKDSLYGYYDGYGFPRIPEQYEEAFSFSNGLAKVHYQGLDAFIDTYGSFAVRPMHETVNFFSDSILIFENDEYLNLMNRNGETISEIELDDIGLLVNERAIAIKDDMMGYLDKKGAWAIQPIYTNYATSKTASEFVGTMAKVKKGEKYGIIDRTGKVIIPFQYSNLGGVSGLVAFEKNGKWGFIDLTNKVVVQPSYEYAESFNNGSAIVQMLTLKGTINAKGQVLIPLDHTEVKQLDKTHYLVSRGAKYGIYSDKGKLLVPLEYGQIRKVQDEFYVMMKGQELHYFYLTEDRIILPQY